MFSRERLGFVNAEDPEEYRTPNIQPVHFWSRSHPDIAKLRKKFIYQWIFASIELWMLIFLVVTLYFGTGHNPNQYADNLDVAVVDFDGDVAGRYFLDAFRQSAPGNSTLHWRYKGIGDYNNNVEDTRSEVDNGYVWAIVVLRPNTTRFINATLSTFVNTSMSITSPFATLPPVLVTYEDGRNTFSINNYVLPPIRSALAVANARYSQMFRQELISALLTSSNSSVDRKRQLSNTFQLRSFLANPISIAYQNLHPGLPYVGQLATTLGYIYLYLISALVVGGAIRFLSAFVGKIHYSDLIIFRIFYGVFQAFMVSLIYSLIVLWFFGIHSGSQFMRYWMFNWLASLVFGIIVVLFTINFGPIGNSALTVFIFLMLAGSTLQLALELAPRFYRYGYGLPLFHIINGGRHLLFDSHTRFALSVGVLLIYVGVLWIVAGVTSTLWLRKQEQKVLREKQKKKTAIRSNDHSMMNFTFT